MVEQFQRAVGDGEFGGLFFHPRFQVLIQLGEVFRHEVEGLPQPPDFVFSGQVGAHGEIALAKLVGQPQQAAQGVDKDVVDQIDGQGYQEKGADDGCPQDNAQHQDFRFGGVFDLLHKIIDAGDEFGDFVQHGRVCDRRRARWPAD